MKKLTREDHRARHVELHRALDELIADWLSHNRRASIHDEIVALMKWSHQQTVEPEEL